MCVYCVCMYIRFYENSYIWCVCVKYIYIYIYIYIHIKHTYHRMTILIFAASTLTDVISDELYPNPTRQCSKLFECLMSYVFPRSLTKVCMYMRVYVRVCMRGQKFL